MRLRNWHIDGFGVFHDASLPEPGLDAGFNLFLGPNEAGKSTLLDFLHYTLFDYPRRGQQPRHEPLFGGKHGGQLTYESDGRLCRLYRSAAKQNAFQLLDEAGTALTETDLNAHLGHLQGEVFRNIFGFSLSELQTLDSLKTGGVRDLIFAASIGGSASRIREVQDTLQSRAETLFREGARSNAQNPPRLIRLEKELERINAQLSEARQASEAVAGKVQLLRHQQSELQAMNGRLAELENEIGALDRLIRGWQPWVGRCQAEQEIKALGDVSRFPPNGELAWAELKAGFQAAHQKVQQARENIAGLQQKLSLLPGEFPLAGHAARAHELKEARAGYDVAVQLAQDADKRKDDAGKIWLQLSEELGQDWPEAVVCHFDVSLLDEDQARTLARKVEDASASHLEKRHAAVARAREARGASAQCLAKRGEIRAIEQSGSIPSEESLAIERKRVAQLRQALHESEMLRNQAERASDHCAQVALLLNRPRTDSPATPTWLRVALWTGGALMVVAALVLYLVGEKVAAGLSGFVALVLAGLAIALHRQPPPVASATPEVAEAEERRRKVQEQWEQHEAKWRSEAAQAGVAWPATEHDLGQREELVAQEDRKRERHARLLQELSGLREIKRRSCMALSEARRELRAARDLREQATRAWTDYLRQRNLPATIQPETAFDLFTKIKQARRAVIERETNANLAKGHHQKAGAHLADVRSFLRMAGRGVETIEPARLFAGLAEVLKEIEKQAQQQETRRDLMEQLNAAEKQLDTVHPVKRAEDQARVAMNDFLAHAGVEDEAGFSKLAARAKRHQQLVQDISGCDQAIAVIFGQDGAPVELRAAWETGSSPDWQIQKAEREAEKTTKAGQRDQLLQEIKGLEIEIDQQVRSEDVARLQLEAETLREQIRNGIDEWLQLATALNLMRETRETFERQNQNPALGIASRLFEKITGGRYARIVLALDTSDLKILPPTGEALTIDSLSRGTLEQLYLCIRLGYIRHYQQQQGVNLPLLMDDVAVNFDPERMGRTLDVLCDLCREGQQILFFTCHDELRRLIQGRAALFRLESFAFKREDAAGN
jgi:uncharacterized protein YhaN